MARLPLPKAIKQGRHYALALRKGKQHKRSLKTFDPGEAQVQTAGLFGSPSPLILHQLAFEIYSALLSNNVCGFFILPQSLK
jgi:hypothetical protein